MFVCSVCVQAARTMWLWLWLMSLCCTFFFPPMGFDLRILYILFVPTVRLYTRNLAITPCPYWTLTYAAVNGFSPRGSTERVARGSIFFYTFTTNCSVETSPKSKKSVPPQLSPGLTLLCQWSGQITSHPSPETTLKNDGKIKCHVYNNVLSHVWSLFFIVLIFTITLHSVWRPMSYLWLLLLERDKHLHWVHEHTRMRWLTDLWCPPLLWLTPHLHTQLGSFAIVVSIIM